MRYASIDVGTNTLRLLIADTDGASMRPVLYDRRITRLGGGYDEAAGISPEAAERTFAALGEFRAHIDRLGAQTVLAFATSVVRRARNRDWFRQEAKKRAGIDITVIDGNEEARLSLAGVLSVIDDRQGKKLIIDVGGGSTEFVATIGPEMAGGWSMELGVVHLTEKHLLGDPPSGAEIRAMENEIQGVIAELKSRMIGDGIDPLDFSGKRGSVFVGTAGTITTLAAIDQDLEAYDRAKINNYTLPKERISAMYGRLCSMTLKERQTVLSLEKGREDLIVPGSAITLLAMEAFGYGSAKVSDAGLLEGIILDRVAPGAALRY